MTLYGNSYDKVTRTTTRRSRMPPKKLVVPSSIVPCCDNGDDDDTCQQLYKKSLLKEKNKRFCVTPQIKSDNDFKREKRLQAQQPAAGEGEAAVSSSNRNSGFATIGGGSSLTSHA